MWSARTGRQAGMFVKHVVPAIAKPARVLWNEIIGFLFLCIAAMFVFAGVRYGIHGNVGKTALAGFSALLLGWYGVTSFWKARKISRS